MWTKTAEEILEKIERLCTKVVNGNNYTANL